MRNTLEAAGIEARPVWRPMRLQLPYQDAMVLGGTVATDLAARILCLPCSVDLTDDEQQDVIGVVRGALGGGFRSTTQRGRNVGSRPQPPH